MRIAIVFVAVTLVWRFIFEMGTALFGPEYDRLGHVVRALLASALAVPTIALARRYLDRRPWNGLRLTSLRDGRRSLLFGMACWLIPAGIGIAVCVGLGWTQITLRTSVAEALAVAAALVLLVFVYEALPEELVFRGYFYRNLATALPRWGAVFGQALLFMVWGLANGGPNSVERSILFFAAALALGMFRAVTGNVWAPIGFHLAFQTVAQLLGSNHEVFVVSAPRTLQMVAFGLLPFGASFLILGGRARWRGHEPEIAHDQRVWS